MTTLATAQMLRRNSACRPLENDGVMKQYFPTKIAPDQLVTKFVECVAVNAMELLRAEHPVCTPPARAYVPVYARVSL